MHAECGGWVDDGPSEIATDEVDNVSPTREGVVRVAGLEVEAAYLVDKHIVSKVVCRRA